MSADWKSFDKLWDYSDPAATEAQFRALLPEAEASGDLNLWAQLLTQIARAEGLQQKFDDARQTLNRAQELLTTAGEEAEEAWIRLALERGRVFNSSGEPEKALPFFYDAWHRAQRERADFYAIDAAHMMAIAEPDPMDQLEWNRRALDKAATSSDPRAAGWAGSLLNNIGWTLHDAGDFAGALGIFERALRWRQERGDPKTIRIARWTVARTLRSLNRLEEALAIQRELLAESESESRDGFVCEEIGECLWLLGQQEKARPFLALAWKELSSDPWLAQNEPERLEKLKERIKAEG